MESSPTQSKTSRQASCKLAFIPPYIMYLNFRIFVCDLLNFSFWIDDSSYKVTYNGITYTGYWAFCAALNRAEDAGHPLYDFKESVKLSFEDFSILFRSDDSVMLPLLRERYQIFVSAGQKLICKYNGCFTNLIAEAGNDALKLINIVIVEFPSFFDVALYKGGQVFFLKRAQILVADLWACFENQGYGRFETVDFITIFADYRIPQLLSHMGVLVYSNELANKLELGMEIPAGSQVESEIRGMSIYAANMIKERIAEKHPGLNVNAIILDYFLWVNNYCMCTTHF